MSGVNLAILVILAILTNKVILVIILNKLILIDLLDLLIMMNLLILVILLNCVILSEESDDFISPLSSLLFEIIKIIFKVIIQKTVLHCFKVLQTHSSSSPNNVNSGLA